MGKKLTDDILKWTLDINGKPAMKELNDLEQNTRKLERTNKDLRVELQKMEANGKKNTEGYKRLNDQIKKNNREISANKTKMGELRKELGVNALTSRQLRSEYRRLKNQMDNMTPNTPEWKKLDKELTKVSRRMNDLRAKGNHTNKMFGQLKGMLMAGGVVGALYAVGRAMMKVIGISMEFGKALSSLSAITGLTGQDLKYFKEQAIETSSQTLKSATEIVKAYELVGSIRPELLKDKQALAEVTKNAIILSEATGGKLALEDAARATAATLNQFSMSADKARKVINVLAAGSKYGAAQVDAVTESIKVFGAVADAANMPLEQSVGLIETLAEKQILGAEAGTKLRNVIIKLEGDQKNYKNGVFDVNLALENLAKRNVTVTELTKMFGKQNVVAAQILVKNRAKVISYTQSVTGTNTALEQQKIQNDNLAGSWKKLGIAWNSFMIKLNNSTGDLKKAVDQITNIINKYDEWNKVFSEHGLIYGMLHYSKVLKEINEREKENAKIYDEEGYILKDKAIKKTTKELEKLKTIYSKMYNTIKKEEAAAYKQGNVKMGDYLSTQLLVVKINLQYLNEIIKKKKEEADLDNKKAIADKKAASAVAAKKAAADATNEAKARASLNGEISKQTEKLKKLKDQRNALKPGQVQQIAYYNREIEKINEAIQGLKDLKKYTGELYALKTKSLKDAILSDDDVEAINANVATVQDSINTVLDNIANKTSEGDGQTKKGAFWQALGLDFNGDDDKTKLAKKLGAVQQMVMNAWANINQIMANADARQLQQFQKTHDQRKAILDKQLNAGKISYEQYTAQLSQLDADLEKKRRKIDHDAAVRNKAMSLVNATIEGALAVVKALSDGGPILAAIVAALAAIQIGVIASTPVPQLAKGNYAQVIGAEDGRTYNARVTDSNHPSGLYNEPTYVPGFGMFGETALPEMVFNPQDTAKLLRRPELIDAINTTLGVRQFAGGNSTEIIRENTTVTQTFTDPELLALMVEIRNYVKQKPEAILVADENYIRTHKQVKEDYDNFQKQIAI